MTSQPLITPANYPTPSSGDYDVVVVGGGVVGLTLACALKDCGMRLALVEAQADIPSTGQAYHISILSSRIFQSLGLWPTLAPQTTTLERVCLEEPAGTRAVLFTPADLGTPAVGYVAEQQVLLSSLTASLQGLANLDWWRPAQVQEVIYGQEWATLKLGQAGQEFYIRTKLVVAADGVRSFVRQAAAIPMYGWKYWQSCLVTTVSTEKPHQQTAYERFWPCGPFAILPLPEARCRIVWTAPHQEAQALLNLPEAEFITALTRQYGEAMGRITAIGERYLFPVQLRQSRRYSQARLALVGDAAHACHPVGGQGVNMGIRDAAALAQVLQKAWGEGKDPGDPAVLRAYGRWRWGENLLVLGLTDMLVRCFSNRWWPLTTLRRGGIALLRRSSRLRGHVLGMMTGFLGRRPDLGRG